MARQAASSGCSLNDGGWWSPWHCHSCVGRRPDISAELAGGGIRPAVGSLLLSREVAVRAGADVGRARGLLTAQSLPFSTLPSTTARCQNFSAGYWHGLGGDAVSLAPWLCLRRRVYRPYGPPPGLVVSAVFAGLVALLAPSSLVTMAAAATASPPQPIQKVNTDAPPQAQVR